MHAPSPSQARRRRPWLFGGMALAVIAAVVGWTLLQRKKPANVARTHPADLKPYSDIRFEPSIASVQEKNTLIQQAVDRVASLASDHSDIHLSSQQRDALKAFVQSRLQLTLNPSRDVWMDMAHAYVPAERMSDMANKAIAYDWSVVEHVWRNARISVKDIAVRILRIQNRDALLAQFGPSMSRNPLRPPYPPAPADATIVEIVVPMMIRESRSESQRRVYVGYSCWWDDSGQRWVPRNTSVYSDHGSLVAPPQ